MATGLTSESSNSGNTVYDDSNITVAQIHAPSTVFGSDTDPLNDFHRSGREDVVTVKDVEEIVEAVRDSFAKFIEVQRSYLDRQRETSDASTENSTSTTESNSLSQTSETVGNSGSNKSVSNELTEATVSDIIEAISEENDSSNNNIENSIAEFKNDVFSKIDSVNNEISEKLIDSSSKNKNEETNDSSTSTADNSSTGISVNDMFKSFVEFMSNSKTDSTTNEKSSSDDSSSKISANEDEKPSLESRDDSNSNIISRIGDYFSELFDDFGEMFSSNKSEDETKSDVSSTVANTSSMADIVNENNRLVETLKTDSNKMLESIAGISNDGIAKSMVDMMVQNSMIQMVTSNTIEGMSGIMSKSVEDNFGNVIRTINDINKNPANDNNTIISPLNNIDDNASITHNTETKNRETVDVKTDNNEIDVFSPSNVVQDDNNSSNVLSSTTDDDNDSDKNIKNETSVESTNPKNGGLFDFIGDTFNSIVSMFKTDKDGKEDKPINNNISVDSEKINEIVSQPSIISTEISENEENESDKSDNTVQQEESEDGDSLSTKTPNLNEYSSSESFENVINRLGLNNENSLHILDDSFDSNEALLDNFQNMINRFKEEDKDVVGAKQIGDVNVDDVLKYYLSGKERRAEEISRMNEALASTSKTSEKNDSNASSTEESSKTSNDNENEKEVSGNMVGEVLENRKRMMERFDKLETSLQSSSTPSTQMIYIPVPDNKFEVDRIG